MTTAKTPTPTPPQPPQRPEAASLESLYSNYRRGDARLSFLVSGRIGSGKTRLIGTARAPILVDVFDPGGERTLAAEIESGRVIPDTRWSSFDSADPKTFTLWLAEMRRRRETPGFFSRLGTYAIDSYTFLQNAAQAELRHRVRGEFDAKSQSVLYQRPIMDVLQWVFALPCDVILTAHLAAEKDGITGATYYTVDAGGFLANRIPALVSEVYVAMAREVVAEAKPGGGGPAREIQYRLLTKPTGAYEARSRLGCLADYEEPDIRAIRRKAGMSAEDKPGIGPEAAEAP